jgi:hypothetical protein
MKVGYIRVSKQEQTEALQRDALKEAGCEKYDIVNLTDIVDELSPLICNLSGEKGEIEQRSMG